jgi:hypothetical protein
MADGILQDHGAFASSSAAPTIPTDEQKRTWLRVRGRLEAVRNELANIIHDEHDLSACPGDAFWDVETSVGFVGSAIDAIDWGLAGAP